MERMRSECKRTERRFIGAVPEWWSSRVFPELSLTAQVVSLDVVLAARLARLKTPYNRGDPAGSPRLLPT